MKTQVAIGAGILGAAVMTLIMAAARVAGYPVNLEMMLGTMIGLAPGPVTWLVGLAMHMAAGAVFAVIYAYGFEHVTHRATAAIGAGFALAHTVFSGMLMGSMPALHPMIPGVLPAPGAFLANVPLGPIVFLLLHLVFGAMVGGFYGPVVHRKHVWSRS